MKTLLKMAPEDTTQLYRTVTLLLIGVCEMRVRNVSVM